MEEINGIMDCFTVKTPENEIQFQYPSGTVTEDHARNEILNELPGTTEIEFQNRIIFP